MAFTTKKIIAGNWKMNGYKKDSWELTNNLMNKFEVDNQKVNFDMIIFPPFLLVSEIVAMLDGSNIKVGVQNATYFDNGAYTGEISATMAADIGVKFVLLGHSERRTIFNETSEDVAKKMQKVIDAKLTPVVCIGENEDEKINGKTEEVLRDLFLKSMSNNATADNIIIAYEPLWAIGTGKVASTTDIISAFNIIRNVAMERFGDSNITILYGGSVKPSNAKEILGLEAVNGVLVGGASLNPDDFWQIAESV